MQLTLTSRLDQPVPANPSPQFRDEAPRRILVHQDFVDWFYAKDSDQTFVKRARFALHKLQAHGYVTGSKSLVGPGKGWLRAGLGGGTGFSQYMWYATHTTIKGQELGLQNNEIAVRLIRPHDDNGLSLDPGQRDEYEALTPSDIESVSEDTGYTPQQISIALDAKAEVQTIRGYPGSGKTTSLLLAGEHAPRGKVLYITYSEKLARDAMEHFSSFRPEGVDIEILTFNTLLAVLENSDKEDFTKTSNVQEAEKFHSALSKRSFLNTLSRRPKASNSWDEGANELYAELHAHCVGRALPIEFRGISASDTAWLTSGIYQQYRKGNLSEALLDESSKIAEFAIQESLFKDHFAHLVRARSLVRDVNEPPPARLRGANCILVDEVQDLTYIEAFTLLNVVARIAVAEGRFPRLVLAGDESQTVRPTAFQWGWLKDLITAVMGSSVTIEDISLDQNMRSPLQIAKFVEATRQQYSKFDKSDRPSGMTYTEVNDARIGRVRYCAIENDDQMTSILELFDQLPNSRIVYPGFSVPDEITDSEELRSVIFTSEEVKGLDYDVVGVIDAGSRIDDLDSLLERGLDDFGRTLADQYRVAASRASETLILFDRNGQDHSTQIREMCKGRAEIELEIDDPDLITLELQGDQNPEELIQSLIDDVKQTIDNQPERAILRSRSIVRQFEKLSHAGPVDDDLKFQVFRTRGVAALIGLLRPNELTRVDGAQLEAEAKSLLQKADLGNAFTAVRDLATCNHTWADKRRLRLLGEAVDQLSRIQIDLPEVFRMYEESLLRWLDQLETKDIPSELALINDVLDVATELVTELEDRHEYLKPLIDDLRIKWSDQAMQMMTTSRYQHSLQLLNGMQHLDHARLGACHEKLKNNKDAAEHWLKANEYEKAINCYRQIPNLDQAIAIAQENESPTLPTLRWLADVRQQFQDRGVGPSQQDLTEAEFKSLKGWADKARIPTPFPRDVEAEPSPLIPRKALPMAPSFDDLEETI
jgi:hypothetical protein